MTPTQKRELIQEHLLKLRNEEKLFSMILNGMDEDIIISPQNVHPTPPVVEQVNQRGMKKKRVLKNFTGLTNQIVTYMKGKSWTTPTAVSHGLFHLVKDRKFSKFAASVGSLLSENSKLPNPLFEKRWVSESSRSVEFRLVNKN